MNAQEIALSQARDELERLRGLLARLVSTESAACVRFDPERCEFCRIEPCPWAAAREEVGK